jgi:hypothetical protein
MNPPGDDAERSDEEERRPDIGGCVSGAVS